MGEQGVPTIPDYLAETLDEGQTLGYDGRTVSATLADQFRAALAGKQIRFADRDDLVGEIWTDRPAFPCAPIWLLGEEYTGRSRADKLTALRGEMERSGAEHFLLASLDDIAWLYNLRGDDLRFNPVFMSYTLVGRERAILYCAVDAVAEDARAALAEDKVELRPYLQIYEDLKGLTGSVLFDRGTTNVALLSALPQGTRRIEGRNPTTAAKAAKTPVEMAHIRTAHMQDGVAVTKLLYWLKHLSREEAEGETELSVSERLLKLREERPGFLDQSFAPIIAAGHHGAIVHYDPDEESNIPLVWNSFLLMDTGGQYWQGTTDITRTAALGTLSQEQKSHYTAVLRGNLNLASAVFKYGCTDTHLDYLARSPLWEQGIDYNHGTGHGVGFLLNVHEGPQSIRPKGYDGGLGAVLEEGMLTSDEPGVYLTDRYGIRLENLMLTVKGERTEFGQFMGFETVTMVPFDRDAIAPEEMTERERAALDAYHARVYENIAPHLTEAERAWLAEVTAPIA